MLSDLLCYTVKCNDNTTKALIPIEGEKNTGLNCVSFFFS